MMAPTSTDVYLICPRKSQQKKHIAVCQRCRHNLRCKPFQNFRQAELPFGEPQKETSAVIEVPRQALNHLRDELKCIENLLTGNKTREPIIGNSLEGSVQVSAAFIKRMKQDLKKIKSLLKGNK
jgi:hypothetical protein